MSIYDMAPMHLDPHCAACGTRLVLSDVLRGNLDDIWYDEFECPVCQDGVRLDWPKEELVDLFTQIERSRASGTFHKWCDIKKKAGSDNGNDN